MGPTVEVDFHYHSRLDPNRFTNAALLLRYRFEGSFISLKSHQLAKKGACSVTREAGAGAPRITQCSALIEAKHERADGTGIRSRRHDTGDDQFLPIRTFGLDPVAAPPGTVWCIGKFGDNALQAQLAGVMGQFLARFGERFTETYAGGGVALAQIC